MIELEDFHEDILGKAMRGLGIGKNEMASRLNVEKSDIEKILAGGVNDELISAIAKELDLDAVKLLRSSTKEWCPTPSTINRLKQFNLPFGEMLVNAFVAWDENSKKAWLFDTGPMAEPILDFLNQESLTVDSIFHPYASRPYCLPR